MPKIDVDVTLLRTSDLAMLVQSDLGKNWVPRSKCEFEPNNHKSESRWEFPIEGVLTMNDGFATEKRLI
jgi:hypothetical protein